MKTTKLIILRGPSGSGKSTTAKRLFDKAKTKVVLMEQDHYRFIFNPAGGGSKPNSKTIHKMIKSDTLIALNDGYDVILEGILGVRSYGLLIEEILAAHPNNNFMYFFDISLDETIKRHQTRLEKSMRFGEEDMREWYPAAHKSNHPLERVIPESYSINDTVNTILLETAL